ncbi:MAG: hypothetical protein ACFB10_11935 [Salibacteraceae bacterium]
MRKYAFLSLLFLASLFAYEAQAQCSGVFNVNNLTTETWTLSIHNVDIPIPPGFSGPVPYTGGIPSASVGAFVTPSFTPFCGFKFLLNAEFIPTPCAINTNGIFYQKNFIDPNGCVVTADVFFF